MSGWIAILLALVLSSPLTIQESALPELETLTALVESGRLEEAESTLRNLLEQSESAVGHHLLGVVLGRQGRLDEAANEFGRALEIEPGFQPAMQQLARIHLQQGKSEAARRRLRAAAGLGPLERDLALWLATEEITEGNFSAATAQFRSVMERFPSVHARVQLARLQASRGEHPAVVALLSDARPMAPNSEALLKTLAKSALANRAPVVALGALEPLTRMHPSVAEYHYLFGVAQLQVNELEGAEVSLERSLQLQPDRALTLVALGLVLNSGKYYQEAREVSLRALTIEPENVEALAALAEAEEALGNFEAAERAAERAVNLNSESAAALHTLGKLRLSQGRFVEARDTLLRSVASNPDLPKAHYQLSLAYARLNDPENSRKHRELYQQALQRIQERMIQMRTEAGLGVPGMGGS